MGIWVKLVRLPALLKIVLAWSVFGLVLASVSFLFPKAPAALLCFYFFFSWLGWLACLFFLRVSKKVYILLGLWILTDISILVTFLSVVTSLGDVGNSQGSEMIWGIAYLPTLFPLGPMLFILMDNIVGNLEGIRTFLANNFGSIYGREIYDWLGFSVMSALQCSIIVALLWSIKDVGWRLMLRSVKSRI